jgi:tRNA pseudouridine38-40 synthase
MDNLKLIIAYDGTRYLGWQNSIETALEHAIEQILGKKAALQAASRTDRGVHAQGQVINFLWEGVSDLTLLRRSLNAVLPADIRIQSIEIASPAFHPTLDAQGKEYRYFVCQGAVQLPFHHTTSWHVPAPLDIEAMERAATALIGTHDFSSFCNERQLVKGDAVREVSSISLSPLPHNRLQIGVRGNRFLYKMVRNLVGTLVYVGCGKLRASEMSAILASKDRTRAGVTAPAHGLFLHQVFYA